MAEKQTPSLGGSKDSPGHDPALSLMQLVMHIAAAYRAHRRERAAYASEWHTYIPFLIDCLSHNDPEVRDTAGMLLVAVDDHGAARAMLYGQGDRTREPVIAYLDAFVTDHGRCAGFFTGDLNSYRVERFWELRERDPELAQTMLNTIDDYDLLREVQAELARYYDRDAELDQ
ncbi:MAG: hypothetical protein ACFB51_21475, partial [Anaerolineae bacterium]